MVPHEYRCPLCASVISREVYERVLRISEARKKEADQRAAALKARLEELERRRDEIERTAAGRERKRVERESAKKQARLAKQIDALEKSAAKERKDLERRLDDRVSVAKREAQGPLRKVIDQLRADLKMREADRRRMEAEFRSAKKHGDAERRHAEAAARARAREAAQKAEQPLVSEITDLKERLITEQQRRARDEEKWKRVADELQQKLASRDQAHFGPEGEEQLVAALKEAFRDDQIDRRGRGGDVLHTVIDHGKPCGVIVYEAKRTAAWKLDYVRQLKKAMELHGTRYGLLVTRTLPKGKSGLCVVNKALVVSPSLVQTVVGILRETIVSLARARLSDQGKAGKVAELYDFLRSDEFTNAMARIDDKIKELRDSLGKERSAHDSWWRSREQHYATIMREASGIDARVNDILSGDRVVHLRRAHG
jgi:hypothetical protein